MERLATLQRVSDRGFSDERRLSSPTLIGRERELTRLRTAVCSPPALIVVEGEAGIGKSRLVREAFSEPNVGGRRVLHGDCHRLRDPFLLGPIVEALRTIGEEPPTHPLSPLAGALRPLLPELARMLPAELEPIGDVRAERHRVFRALRELLCALGPAVCVLEDVTGLTRERLSFFPSCCPSRPGTWRL